MYAPLGPRVRSDVIPAGRECALPKGVGYFESADVNGLGQVIQWNPLTRTSPNPTISDSPKEVKWCIDEVHPGYPLAGGPFFVLRYANAVDPGGVYSRTTVYNRVSNPNVNGGKPYTNRRFVGGFIHPGNSVFGSDFTFNVPGPLFSKTNPLVVGMDGLHDRAWLATKPRLEQSSALVDAAELDEAKGMVNGSRDFLERSKTAAKRFNDIYLDRVRGSGWAHSPTIGPKAVANEFLNQSFGWAPFLSSILDWAKILGHYENLVKKLTKMNGVPVRKRVVLDDEMSSTVVSKVENPVNGISYPMPCYPTAWPADFFVRPPSWEVREEISRTAWGVGKFTYYRPEFDMSTSEYYSEWNKAKRFLTITGLRVSPSALYNMIPWTWLVDYVTDLGNWIDLLTDIWVDQIVAHYCFAMQTVVKRRVFTNILPFHDGTRSLTFVRDFSTKQRDMADNPFGFGLTLSDLTPRQLMIIGALGLTGQFSGQI